MHRPAVLHFLVVSICTMSVPVPAQQLQADDSSSSAAQSPAVRQSAMNLIEEALAGTGSLTLPTNRLAIELRAFPIVWSRSGARGRALVQQMAGEFGQAANAVRQNPDQNPQSAIENLGDQRVLIARGIANSDPELGLTFLAATLPNLQLLTPEDAEDHALVMELAAEVALHDPRRALELAERQLKKKDDLPQTMIGLLEQVERGDPQTGARLFADIVEHLHEENLAEDTEDLAFAASLLGSQYSRQSETGKPDDSLRALAEMVATAAASSNVLEVEPYLLNGGMDALDALVPAKSAALHRENGVSGQPPSPAPFWQRFNQARSTGDSNQVLALLSQAPEDSRTDAAEKAAWDFASNGDLERASQLAGGLEAWKRNGILQLAIRTAALAAGDRSDFPGARQLAAQITDDDSRASLLSDLAVCAYNKDKARVADELLNEASSLVMNDPPGTSGFNAQLRVAEAYLRVKPKQAVALLERSASQIEQALSAAAQLDGFLPDAHSFEGSELILGRGFLYSSLLEPYALVTAELASLDLEAARTLADRLPLPEARLITEVFVATGVLDKKDQMQAASNSGGYLRSGALGDHR